jgi:hypothetical protein
VPVRRVFYRHLGGVCGPGSRGVYGRATDFFAGLRVTLQGYSASHYTFSVYRQPYTSACEPTVRSVVFSVAYSLEYFGYLQGSLWYALHLIWTHLTCFCTSRHDNSYCFHSHPRVHSLQILIPSTSTRIQARGLQGTYPL